MLIRGGFEQVLVIFKLGKEISWREKVCSLVFPLVFLSNQFRVLDLLLALSIILDQKQALTASEYQKVVCLLVKLL